MLTVFKTLKLNNQIELSNFNFYKSKCIIFIAQNIIHNDYSFKVLHNQFDLINF